MPELKSLKFTIVPTDGGRRDPTLYRRAKLIERLEDQKKLLDNPGYARTIQSRTTKDGQKTTVEKQLKVQPWWRTDDKGAVVFFVRHGWKPIEFEKGKAGIAVGTEAQLQGVIDTLIAATRAGELDGHLAKASAATGFGRAKRAA